MIQPARLAPEKQLVFAATGASFLSATLLFSIQPMFTKMVLPVLGGSAATWSVAMVFFQGALLLGYAYAHCLTRYLSFRAGAFIHIALLVTAFTTLPIGFNVSTASQTDLHPALWILATFTVALGLPFLALSTHGPLLQAWFARSNHERSQNPYFLYIASNIGSFAALIAYPLLIEPFLGLTSQSQLWRAGFLALILLIVFVAVRIKADLSAAPVKQAEATPVDRKTALTWTGLAFIPSALLVSVTSHISTDIAAAPLLWVIPLGLYLLSYTIAFRDRLALIKPNELHILLVWGVTGLLMNMMMGRLPMAISLAVHLSLFTVIAIACHHALYQRRPPTQQLTAFYFCMSLGGVLGGLFAGLIAPAIFSRILEYPLMLVLSLTALPGAISGLREVDRKTDVLRPMLFSLAILLIAFGVNLATPHREVGMIIICIASGGLVLVRWRQSSGSLLAIALSFLNMSTYKIAMADEESYRSFYGVTQLKEIAGDEFRVMLHGTTIHGAMRIRTPDGKPFSDRPLPTTYYAYEGAMGEAIADQRQKYGPLKHTALVGLGTGALACHFKKDEAATFYELDPLIAKLAQERTKFRFLSDCDTRIPIIIGDARLTLAQQKEKSDIVLIDAFSSDSIPVHLLTLEAIDLYLSKLEPNGRIVLHISNNFFDLREVLARAAAKRGLQAIVKVPVTKTIDTELRSSSSVAVLARSSADLDSLRSKEGWQPLPAPQRPYPWTDDYSTILEPLIDMWRRNRS